MHPPPSSPSTTDFEQLEDSKRERARLKQQFDFERKRRWRVLEESGDLEQTVREVYGWEEGGAGGVLALPAAALKKLGGRWEGDCATLALGWHKVLVPPSDLMTPPSTSSIYLLL